MSQISDATSLTRSVTNFHDLISIPFVNKLNAIGWIRTLAGDFSDIVKKIEGNENITELDEDDLYELNLTKQGQLARQTLISDMKLLRDHGSSPSLNLIRYYDTDDTNPFFPTDVYSFHVDRAPVPTDTFLCTYYGETSEILPNSYAERKVLIPEILEELKKLYKGPADGFMPFLSEHFFDLHYQARPGAIPISLGQGQMWRLAVDHPESKVLPCVHRAPREKAGQSRLLLIC
ncbi:MAG: hypothetical protein V4721_18625 [Bacteroidota bacterium]